MKLVNCKLDKTLRKQTLKSLFLCRCRNCNSVPTKTKNRFSISNFNFEFNFYGQVVIVQLQQPLNLNNYYYYYLAIRHLAQSFHSSAPKYQTTTRAHFYRTLKIKTKAKQQLQQFQKSKIKNLK